MESANCATTTAFVRRRLDAERVVLHPSLTASCRSTRAPRMAGATPKSTTVASVIARVNSSTVGSTVTSRT